MTKIFHTAALPRGFHIKTRPGIRVLAFDIAPAIRLVIDASRAVVPHPVQ